MSAADGARKRLPALLELPRFNSNRNRVGKPL
jgi:hypothetical protein